MTLLIFHLVLSGFTSEGVDILMAQKILDWNLRRYSNGVFFLFGHGRLRLIRGQPALAIESYRRAMNSQSQYANLHQISYWEMATSNLSLWLVEESLGCWRHLLAESSWSKAIYSYGVAACLLQLGGAERAKEAAELLEKVPGLMQKIAGKSIPMEVSNLFVHICEHSHQNLHLLFELVRNSSLEKLGNLSNRTGVWHCQLWNSGTII